MKTIAILRIIVFIYLIVQHYQFKKHRYGNITNAVNKGTKAKKKPKNHTKASKVEAPHTHKSRRIKKKSK